MSNPNKPICLVVPSIRPDSLQQFIDRWNNLKMFDHVDLMVVEDNHQKIFNHPQISSNVHHYAWDDIDRDLGENSWIIPRRSDTVRSYGYYKAWSMGYQFIVTLDDDCYPPTKEDGLYYETAQAFLQEHLNALTSRSKWFNTLNSVKPRGIPYFNIGQLNTVMVNHGLWTNVLDYDAPTQLAHPTAEKFSFDNRVVPQGMYFPMCGMNLMWRGPVTVLMYHLLMGMSRSSNPKFNPSLTKLPFDRFGDIWCGIIMKKILDLFGFSVATGMPYIRHERASNPFTNLKKEANGIEVNEKLWEYIDSFAFPSGKVSLPGVYAAMGRHVAIYNGYSDYAEYFRKLGEAMEIWAGLFEEKK